MQVDRRTFYIVLVIVIISLPIIVFAFRDSFLPIIQSLREIFIPASLNTGTGVPPYIK